MKWALLHVWALFSHFLPMFQCPNPGPPTSATSADTDSAYLLHRTMDVTVLIWPQGLPMQQNAPNISYSNQFRCCSRFPRPHCSPTSPLYLTVAIGWPRQSFGQIAPPTRLVEACGPILRHYLDWNNLPKLI